MRFWENVGALFAQLRRKPIGAITGGDLLAHLAATVPIMWNAPARLGQLSMNLSPTDPFEWTFSSARRRITDKRRTFVAWFMTLSSGKRVLGTVERDS